MSLRLWTRASLEIVVFSPIIYGSDISRYLVPSQSTPFFRSCTMADVANRVQDVAKEEASKVSAMTKDAVESRAYLAGQV